MLNNKRNYNRIETLNLSYIAVDENNCIIKQGIGRTLNVSQSGILLETSFFIELNSKISLSIGLEDDLVEFAGTVIHTKKEADGKFGTGIKFNNIDKISLQILKIFIKFFNEQKNKQK